MAVVYRDMRTTRGDTGKVACNVILIRRVRDTEAIVGELGGIAGTPAGKAAVTERVWAGIRADTAEVGA